MVDTMAADKGVALSLRDVGRRFGGVKAVSGVNFEVAYGERRVVLGPNGAGKSTLFNLVAGDIRPTSGQVFLFGKDVTRLNPRFRVRHGLTRTYQTAHLFGGLTTLENLYLALRGVKPYRLSIRRPGLHDTYMRYARDLAEQVGLQKVITRQVATLSHGEQRQLELGMALAGNPRMIILDEPAAGLSQGERGRLAELLRGLDPNITLLLIEHDMDIALQIADIVTIMHNGEVVIHGTPDEIRHSQKVSELYMGASHHA
jgi:branched-chain amino acid transport system ATP-binding protein